MTNIYEQHDKAFNRVQAFVILKDGERVATIAFKFPRDGAGRLYAYVHWLGIEMVRGHAGGYGYDKRSAAVESAVAKSLKSYDGKAMPEGYTSAGVTFHRVLRDVGGNDWTRALQDAGFTVLQAV